jgi:hypothetical protein
MLVLRPTAALVAQIEQCDNARTAAPTATPTASPTASPTVTPTATPTANPTVAATLPTCSNTDTTVSYDGYVYRTLYGASKDDSTQQTNQEQTYMEMPAGYEVTPDPDNADIDGQVPGPGTVVANVIAEYNWGIFRLCTASKCWATRNYPPLTPTAGPPGTVPQMAGKYRGHLIDTKAKWSQDGNNFRTDGNIYRLLIRSKCWSAAPTPSPTRADRLPNHISIAPLQISNSDGNGNCREGTCRCPEGQSPVMVDSLEACQNLWKAVPSLPAEFNIGVTSVTTTELNDGYNTNKCGVAGKVQYYGESWGTVDGSAGVPAEGCFCYAQTSNNAPYTSVSSVWWGETKNVVRAEGLSVPFDGNYLTSKQGRYTNYYNRGPRRNRQMITVCSSGTWDVSSWLTSRG